MLAYYETYLLSEKLHFGHVQLLLHHFSQRAFASASLWNKLWDSIEFFVVSEKERTGGKIREDLIFQ